VPPKACFPKIGFCAKDGIVVKHYQVYLTLIADILVPTLNREHWFARRFGLNVTNWLAC